MEIYEIYAHIPTTDPEQVYFGASIVRYVGEGELNPREWSLVAEFMLSDGISFRIIQDESCHYPEDALYVEGIYATATGIYNIARIGGADMFHAGYAVSITIGPTIVGWVRKPGVLTQN